MIVVAGMVPEQGDAAIAGDCDAVNHRMVNYFSWMRADKQRQVFEANREEHSFLKTGRDDWISLIARSDCTTQRIGYCIGLLGGGLMRSESDCRQTCRQLPPVLPLFEIWLRKLSIDTWMFEVH